MTNNQLTREKAQWLHDACEESADAGIKLTMNPNELLMFTSYVLAAMDSEPADKPFMYGIADHDGNAHIDEFCVSEDLGLVEDAVNELNYDREDGDELNYSVVPLYRHAQQAPVVPDECYQQLSELYHAQEKRLFKIAQRIKGPAFDKYSHSSSQAIDVLEAAIFGEDEACRAAMLAAAPQEVK